MAAVLGRWEAQRGPTPRRRLLEMLTSYQDREWDSLPGKLSPISFVIPPTFWRGVFQHFNVTKSHNVNF